MGSVRAKGTKGGRWVPRVDVVAVQAPVVPDGRGRDITTTTAATAAGCCRHHRRPPPPASQGRRASATSPSRGSLLPPARAADAAPLPPLGSPRRSTPDGWTAMWLGD